MAFLLPLAAGLSDAAAASVAAAVVVVGRRRAAVRRLASGQHLEERIQQFYKWNSILYRASPVTS